MLTDNVKLGDILDYDNGVFHGQGRVVGISSNAAATIGRGLILEDLSKNVPNSAYPFTHFVCFEVHCSPAKEDSTPGSPYGYCPTCGKKGVSRERRLDGNDTCEAGHTYPSRDAILRPQPASPVTVRPVPPDGPSVCRHAPFRQPDDGPRRAPGHISTDPDVLEY